MGGKSEIKKSQINPAPTNTLKISVEQLSYIYLAVSIGVVILLIVLVVLWDRTWKKKKEPKVVKADQERTEEINRLLKPDEM